MFENGCYLRRQKRFKCAKKETLRKGVNGEDLEDGMDDTSLDDEHRLAPLNSSSEDCGGAPPPGDQQGASPVHNHLTSPGSGSDVPPTATTPTSHPQVQPGHQSGPQEPGQLPPVQPKIEPQAHDQVPPHAASNSAAAQEPMSSMAPLSSHHHQAQPNPYHNSQADMMRMAMGVGQHPGGPDPSGVHPHMHPGQLPNGQHFNHPFSITNLMSGQPDPTQVGLLDKKMYEQMYPSYGQMSPASSGIVPKEYQMPKEYGQVPKDYGQVPKDYGQVPKDYGQVPKEYKDPSPVPQVPQPTGDGSYYRSYTPHSTAGL